MNTTGVAVYEHSGALGRGGFVLPVVAFVATLIFSVAYGFGTVYSPVGGYISLLFVLAFGGCIALSLSYAGYYAKCRNAAYVRRVGFFAGLLAFYLSWAVFAYALLTRFDETVTGSLLSIVLSPRAVWGFAKALSVEGWYSISGFTPQGGLLWIFWILEAAIIIAMPTFLVTWWLNKEVYCETCDRWCPSSEVAVRLAVPEDAAQVVHFQAGRIEALEALPSVPEQTSPRLNVDVKQCQTCQATAAYIVHAVELVPGKGGKTDIKALTDYMLISPKTANRIKALADRPPVPPARSQTPVKQPAE